MEIIGLLVVCLIGVFIFGSLKNSFDSAENKLFRKVWSTKRFNNDTAIEQEVESHRALREMFDVNIDSVDETFQRNTVRLFSAAHDFDLKYPNNLGTTMIDEVGSNLRASLPYNLSTDEQANKQAKVDFVLELATRFIGMRKATERMGISYPEMIKGFWDEGEKDEIEEFQKKHTNLSFNEKLEAFFLKKLSENVEQESK